MHFENREQVIQFQKRLDGYVRSKNQEPLWHYSLETAYDICCIKWDAKKFSALVDLRINSMLVDCDLTEVKGLWDELDIRGISPQQYLEDDSIFVVRMKIHQLLSGVAFRYRAWWDKLCDFILSLELTCPRSKEQCERIIKEGKMEGNGKSRLRKLILETPMNPDLIVEIYHYLQRFDSEYRTPEAHSLGGKMSKWTLSACSSDDSPFEEFLLDAWNHLNNIEAMLGKVFGEEALRLINAEINLRPRGQF